MITVTEAEVVYVNLDAHRQPAPVAVSGPALIVTQGRGQHDG
jgi:hypothetical protein